MKVGNTLLIAPVIGVIWAVIYTVVFSVLAMLITGETLVPDIGTAAISGAIGAFCFVVIPVAWRGVFWVVMTAFVALFVSVFLNATFAVTDLSAAVLSIDSLSFITAFVTYGVSAISWHLCLSDIGPENQARYQLEVILLRVLKGLGFVFFTIIVALPFYVMLMTSLKSQQSLLANPLDLSINLTQAPATLFRSYIELFTKYKFGDFLLNSAVVSVVTVIITLLFSIPGAYAVSRLKFPGQAILSRSILLIYMVPAIVLVIPLYAVFSQLGLRNSLLGLVIVYPATTIPVAVYMLQGYFRGLPYELEEAGLMDGLTRLGVILKITLPLSLPALASVSLYIFMIAWNEFLFAFMFLDDPGFFTLSRGVQALNSSEIPRQHLMAGAVIATLPVLVLFLWFERFLVAGLTAGSVKG